MDIILPINAMPNPVTAMTDRSSAQPPTKRNETALETAIRTLRRGDVVCLTGSDGAALMLAISLISTWLLAGRFGSAALAGRN